VCSLAPPPTTITFSNLCLLIAIRAPRRVPAGYRIIREAADDRISVAGAYSHSIVDGGFEDMS
jgi:hypothetical protein